MNSTKTESKIIPSQEDSAQDATGTKAAPQPPPEVKHKRTTGLRLFDVMLYPLITNVGVFVISVAATYLTNKGNLTTKGRQLDWQKDTLMEGEKLVYGKTGEFFQKRGAWLVEKFKGMGMKEDTANMSKMVFFSFADGSLMAPFVKMLEDRREKIGKWIDRRLGSEPDDPSVYKAEPKQSWTSVLGGRAATAAIVVNTAVALNAKVLPNKTPELIEGKKISFNDKLFNIPGIKLGNWINKNPGVAKFFGKHDGADIARVSIFEAVYTSICTAGLYFSSRLFARKLNERQERKLAEENTATQLSNTTSGDTSDSITETRPVRQFASESLRSSRLTTPPASSHAERTLQREQSQAALTL